MGLGDIEGKGGGRGGRGGRGGSGGEVGSENGVKQGSNAGCPNSLQKLGFFDHELQKTSNYLRKEQNNSPSKKKSQYFVRLSTKI